MRLNTKLVMALAVVAMGGLVGCPPAGVVAPKKVVPLSGVGAGEVRWRVYAARREGVYVKLELPVVTAGMVLTIGEVVRVAEAAPAESVAAEGAAPATAPATGPTTSLARKLEERAEAKAAEVVAGWGVVPFTTRILRGAVEGPLVEQLTGGPRAASDGGSYLVGLSMAGEEASGGGGAKSYEVKEPMPVYVKVTVPAGAEAGEYRVGVRVSVPGKGVEEGVLAVEVADIALPTEPRVLAVGTTTVGELSKIYPLTFGEIAGQYLDRANPDHKAAVEQLDALVRAARAQGVALFVEDIIPTTRVDELGQVTIDWDSYDRLMQPYMEGTAFEDRVPLAVWMAPVPPRRIRDSSTQLWQFMEACAKHFAEKRWVAVPAFLHPALANSEAENLKEVGSEAELEKLRGQVAEMMRLHMPREMLAVAAPAAEVPHGQLWAVNDDDPRLPPAGAMGSEYSVRAWPWVCVARGNTAGGSPTGVKGLVWRDAVARKEDLKGAGGARALLVVDGNSVEPSLRMVWLNAGLNDAALLGLLEKRTDVGRTGVVGEILAGMAGRTGSPAAGPGVFGAVGVDAPIAATGFLYAGWPVEKSVWSQVTPTLQKLVLANDPGTRASVKADDPLYLGAKLWLAQTRRPVARVAGYGFSMRPGARGIGSDILDARVALIAENPIGATAEVELRFVNLPGDFDLAPEGGAGARPGADEEFGGRKRTVTMGAAAVAGVVLPLAGHVETVMEAPKAEVLEITERYGGAVLPLPVVLPIYRVKGLEAGQAGPKLDGNGEDWALDNQTRAFGEMKVGTRYVSRPDLLAGKVRADEKAASVRWTFDKDFLYLLAKCPQEILSDERNTEWPVRAAGEGVRWWGSDGLQIVLGPMAATVKPATLPGVDAASGRLVKVAFKPAGVVLVQTGQVGKAGVVWRDGPPPGGSVAGIKYGVTIQKSEGRVTGYTVEAAIPRAWVEGANGGVVEGTRGPAWRVNVLRHRGGELVSTSWAGPLVEDDDVGMMGALIGE